MGRRNGPPVSDLKTGNFGDGSQPEYWPLELMGRSLTDYNVPSSAEGAAKIRELILNYVKP